jgi:hypothetical protein
MVRFPAPDGFYSLKGALPSMRALNNGESVRVCNALFNRLSDLFQRTGNAFFRQGVTLLDQQSC